MFQLWDNCKMYVPMKAYASYCAALDAVGILLTTGFLFRKIVVGEDGALSWGPQAEY